jgi:hypothetical protein
MRNVELTLAQRLRLALLIGEQKGTVAQIRLWSAVLGKLDLSRQERDEIGFRTTELPDGRVAMQWDPERARAAKPIALENEEARAVSALVASHPGFAPADLEWVDTLLRALDRKETP